MAPEQILDFWFPGEPRDEPAAASAMERWFQADPAFDEAIRVSFSDAVKHALQGGFDEWREEPGSRLALILLLDQMTRNIFRGSAEAFAGDARALALCREGLDRGHDLGLRPFERMFFYLPLEHVEDKPLQEHSVFCYEQLAKRARPPYEAALASGLEYAKMHRDIIVRFGRFPHRNKVLGRTSTPAEQIYLDGEGMSFGQ